MIMLGAATILTAWSAWMFRAKSEDPNRPQQSKDEALAVSNHLHSLFVRSIKAGDEIGINNGRPEQIQKYIKLTVFDSSIRDRYNDLLQN
jgi:hypothetical protein